MDAPELDEVRTLLALAAMGDRDALPLLRRPCSTAGPASGETLGDLATHVQMAWVHRIGRSDVAVKEALGRRADALRNELAAPGATPLERLLIDRVVATWLEVHAADLDAAVVGDVLPEKVPAGDEAAGGRRAPPRQGDRVAGERTPAATVRRGAEPEPGGPRRADPDVVDGEPVDVVPFAPAPRSRRATGGAESAGRRSTRGRARQAGEPGRAWRRSGTSPDIVSTHSRAKGDGRPVRGHVWQHWSRTGHSRSEVTPKNASRRTEPSKKLHQERSFAQGPSPDT